jgi:CRP/FNR family cyclic AMP-dependent transcriptional regulator
MSTTQVSDSFKLMGAGKAFKEEICEMIAETRLFMDLDWKDIEGLANYVQCYQMSAGTIIFKEGDTGSYMCLLIKGQVEIFKNDQDGKPHRIVQITHGKTIGEMSIIDGEPRSATCIASQESVLLLLTKDSYARIIKERPGLAVHILSKLAKLMSQRLRGVSGQLVEYLGPERRKNAPLIT